MLFNITLTEFIHVVKKCVIKSNIKLEWFFMTLQEKEAENSLKSLLVDLQNKGLRTGGLSGNGRRGGAGPTDDQAFLFQGQAVMLPTLNNPAERSPYSLEKGESGLFVKHQTQEIPLGFLEAVKRPKFYEFSTKEGIPYNKIAVAHRADVLASTVIQSCIRWSPEKRCKLYVLELQIL